MRIESSITINRPAEDIWEYLIDFEKNKMWNPATVDMRLTSEGPLRKGSTYVWVGQFLGRHIESNTEVTEFEPGRKFSYKIVSGPFPGTASTTLEPAEGGTRVTIRSEGDMGGFFKLAEPVMARMSKRQIEGMLANLKDLVEAQG
jgi:carbon monoxide dehydrogenase subunit G